MKQYVIRFNFNGQVYDADVTEIGGLDDTQFAISQRDEKLAERFKTNIIRKVNNESGYQYTLPEAVGGDEFMQSLVRGLEDTLQKK